MSEPDYWWERRREGEMTPEYIGRVLDELHFPGMAKRARLGHFDDFFAPAEVADGMELHRLVAELRSKKAVVAKSGRPRIDDLIGAVVAGEFDATQEESARWATSLEAQKLFEELINGQ
jgi:hypothetical protein